MIRRTLAAAGYDLYQSVVAVAALVVVLHFLFEYGWTRSLGYAVATIGAYWAGQGLVVVIKAMTRRSSLD